MYGACGMTPDELPRTTAATKQILAMCAADVLVIGLLTAFELPG